MKQTQDSPGLESKMEPRPDYGYTSYKGSDKLQGKVAIITGTEVSIHLGRKGIKERESYFRCDHHLYF
jgi:hypothetical protein